jgi:hypothetical protein
MEKKNNSCGKKNPTKFYKEGLRGRTVILCISVGLILRVLSIKYNSLLSDFNQSIYECFPSGFMNKNRYNYI